MYLKATWKNKRLQVSGIQDLLSEVLSSKQGFRESRWPGKDVFSWLFLPPPQDITEWWAYNQLLIVSVTTKACLVVFW